MKNISSLILSFLNTERREVVFRTQWFIGQYCGKREGRGYHCRCTSVPLSLYFISILWRLVITAFHRRPVKVDGSSFFQIITGAKVRLFFFLFLQQGLAFPHFFSTLTTRPSFCSLSQCPTGLESRRFSCQCRVIVHYDTSAMKRFLTSIVRNFISRGVKMRISAREACVKPHLRTGSDIKLIFLYYKYTLFLV